MLYFFLLYFTLLSFTFLDSSAVLHYAKAASMGSLQAISHLAHALYDPESWLNSYARDEMNKLFSQGNISNTGNILLDETNKNSIPGNVPKSDGDFTTNVLQNDDEIVENYFWRFIEDFQANLLSFVTYLFLEPPIDPNDLSYETLRALKSETAAARLNRWKYNSSIPIFITLPGILGPVMHPLPHPLWSLATSHELPHQTLFSTKISDYLLQLRGKLCAECMNDINCQQSCADNLFVSGCDSSLVLLKYLVEFSTRPLELMVY